jgi:hypothetical protein
MKCPFIFSNGKKVRINEWYDVAKSAASTESSTQEVFNKCLDTGCLGEKMVV